MREKKHGYRAGWSAGEVRALRRYLGLSQDGLAEELGMRIGIHPDDPPVEELGGVPRCIFGNFAGYARALEIANSPNIWRPTARPNHWPSRAS